MAPVKVNGHRTPSNAMAAPFMVSAPGKVIVFGEHAVVHGKAAMAAAISLRSYLLVTTLSKTERTVSLAFPDIKLDHTWKIDELPWSVFTDGSVRKPKYYDLVTSLDKKLMEALYPHIEAVSPEVSEHKRKVHQNAAAAFLYLFMSLASPTAPGCLYTLRSTLPIGAGLGSSASICVCISAALLKQIHVLSGPHHDQPQAEVEVQLERINQWAFVGELCIHGNPSGVDNTVATRGKAVLFKRNNFGKPPDVTPLKDFPELPLLLVNTNQPRQTSVEVAKVGALLKVYPSVTQTILDGIEEITLSAHKLISTETFSPENSEDVAHIGDLFRLNHGLLVALGVSHPKLEHIRELIDHTDIGWTKLTGAGGGGCAITLLKDSASPATIEDLKQKFEKAGFEEYRTSLGGDGVGILYPAALRNGTQSTKGEDEMDEIDHQKFVDAKGEEEVEKLVGIGGVTERREEWKFWR